MTIDSIRRKNHQKKIVDQLPGRGSRKRFLDDSQAERVTFGPRGFRCSFDNAIQGWCTRVLRLKEETSGFEAFESFISHRRLDEGGMKEEG